MIALVALAVVIVQWVDVDQVSACSHSTRRQPGAGWTARSGDS